ncbi:hypothetical protein KSF_112020 [Reticulibacter mediterranei]|uniref:DUF998 domain-containing protein n=2 Tax=Reticulibacter mediterranei TaxID=2778369 RepID=A0A8J3N7F5_9CHLR|nr:hypothetical protein KSF_112020 [Reticulibacter mediterranei]
MSKQYDVVPEGPNCAVAQPDRSLTPQTFPRQRVLAAAGICAPILFALGFVMQGFLRTDLRLGYNPIAQEVSDLTAGPLGWVQQVNFLVFGLLVIAFGIGLYRGVRKASPWMVGPALVVWNGIELIIAGLFPRSENVAGHIYDPLGVHMMNGMLFFLSIGIVLVMLSFQLACDERWRNLVIYTRVTGILVFVLNVLNGFFAEATGDPLHPWLGLFQRTILAVWFLCLIILALRLWRLGGRDAVEMRQVTLASNNHPESQGFPILPSSRSAEGGSPLPGCGVSPQKPFFFSFARRLRRRAKEGRKLGTPQAPAGRPLHPFERRTGKPCPESDHVLTRYMPRWVIIFVLIILLIVLTVVIIEITNNGMGDMQMAIPGYLSAIAYGGQAQ